MVILGGGILFIVKVKPDMPAPNDRKQEHQT